MIASSATSPAGATAVRLRMLWHLGQVLALAEIIAPHARHDVILAMTLPRRPPFVRRITVRHSHRR
jgi:hypothetical protein